ncbi:MAG: hypothetical protein KA743_09075 [Geothrix sp.]|nr:hypothetical protein [Geothrix sp.]
MKTFLRHTSKVFAGLLVLLVLFHWVENWRGNRAWKALLEEDLAAGQPATLAGFAPPLIPDGENFASVPRIAAAAAGTTPLMTLPEHWPAKVGADWREGQRTNLEAYRPIFPGLDLRKGLEGYRDSLDEIVQASKRPGSRLAIDYARYPDPLIPNLLGFRAAGRLLQLRALVALKDGRTEAAFEDVCTLLRLVQHFEKEPILLCQLLRMAYAGMALQPIWEGLETHAWSSAQLDTLQGALARIDFLAPMDRSWRAEGTFIRSFSSQITNAPFWSLDPYRSVFGDASASPSKAVLCFRWLFVPRGWLLQNAARGSRALRETMSGPIDLAAHRMDPRRQEEALKDHFKPSRHPYAFLVSVSAPALAAQNIRVARFQADYTEARIACDLERHHRAKGSYPERLAELGVPLPMDVIGGQPLRYLRTPEGGYVLYSLGWNGTDEGGQPGSGDDAIRRGDWVWRIRGGTGAAGRPSAGKGR